MINYQDFPLLRPYNPWWINGEKAFESLPNFRRPVFNDILYDLRKLPQILSLTGPRRIGKSTLLKQLVQELMSSGVNPEKLLYYSLDDPLLELEDVPTLITQAMEFAFSQKEQGPFYFFLDEIQKLTNWELYLKKYYDLEYPVRFVISGSASSPIFSKSRESLLGRIKQYHLLPFSFKEYVLYHLKEDESTLHDLGLSSGRKGLGQSVVDVIDDRLEVMQVEWIPEGATAKVDPLLRSYFLEGGFPETWTMETWQQKQEYLVDNQINKVIFEDLVLAADFRKPELLKRFYLSLLQIPGQEANVTSISQETGINAQQIEKYLPLLEMTDLIFHVSKFRQGALKVRRGNMKFYLSDLALRNAVLRLDERLLDDTDTLGRYAENLVYLQLRQWRGTLQTDYFRESDEEIDFVLHVRPGEYVPIEVKYRDNAQESPALRKFCRKYRQSAPPLLVTKRWDDRGRDPNDAGSPFRIPLPLFLLHFD